MEISEAYYPQLRGGDVVVFQSPLFDLKILTPTVAPQLSIITRLSEVGPLES